MHYKIEYTLFLNILKILKTIKKIHTNNLEPLEKFINAAYFILRGGAPWRLLPPSYGHWRAVHKRFVEWSKRGIWKIIFKEAQIDPDLEQQFLDSTVVRAHACAAGYQKNSQKAEALGRSAGGFSTKIHAKTEGLGLPLTLILTAGNSSDFKEAENLLEGSKDTQIIADKGYDSDNFIAAIKRTNSDAIIPPKKNRIKLRDYDKHLYKERHQIECFFGKIKHFRRVFSRYDKIANVYLSFLHFASALIWFR